MLRIATLLLVLSGVILVDTAEARRNRSYRSRGAARPVTGYGANLHRTFVLKQELRRQRSGKPVRNRGNILWYR